jgi:site-specific DNA-methyltransferase (adenine-specific)/adenine-specific DNA-methyltransferase
LYDFGTLKDLPWKDWRFFALQLFECTDRRRKIGGLEVDGDRRGSPVLVFDWKSKPGQSISEDTIADIHSMVGKKVGKAFYIIAPIMSFDFFQDYIDLEGVRYYALRIPYTMIAELHTQDFRSITQARAEKLVNEIAESHGFSFMVAPEVEWEAGIVRESDSKKIFLRTTRFTSLSTDVTEGQIGFESLSMLMIDLDYDGKIFDLDHVAYGEQLEANGWMIEMPSDRLGKEAMAVWIDNHGNESKAVISAGDFGFSAPRAKTVRAAKKQEPTNSRANKAPKKRSKARGK